ncbi:hypothetical protein PanWU01x14_007590, partial [Parasponia andersonii]
IRLLQSRERVIVPNLKSSTCGQNLVQVKRNHFPPADRFLRFPCSPLSLDSHRLRPVTGFTRCTEWLCIYRPLTYSPPTPHRPVTPESRHCPDADT